MTWQRLSWYHAERNEAAEQKPLTDMIHIKPITRRQYQLSVYKVMNVIWWDL